MDLGRDDYLCSTGCWTAAAVEEVPGCDDKLASFARLRISGMAENAAWCMGVNALQFTGSYIATSNSMKLVGYTGR